MIENDLPIIARIFTFANPHDTSDGIADYTIKTLGEFPQFCWVAENSLSGEIIGGITGNYINDGKAGYILDIAIAPPYRQKGYGKQLLLHELQAFNKAGVKVIKLDIHYLNASIVPFYSRYGFRLHAIKLDEFGPGQDAIEMLYKQEKLGGWDKIRPSQVRGE